LLLILGVQLKSKKHQGCCEYPPMFQVCLKRRYPPIKHRQKPILHFYEKTTVVIPVIITTVS